MNKKKNDVINNHAFLSAQIEEMLKYKWCKSMNAGYDLGQDALFEWIDLYAKDFRKNWLKSQVG